MVCFLVPSAKWTCNGPFTSKGCILSQAVVSLQSVAVHSTYCVGSAVHVFLQAEELQDLMEQDYDVGYVLFTPQECHAWRVTVLLMRGSATVLPFASTKHTSMK